MPLFPALAIPAETKSEYESPPEHLRPLERSLPEVTKVLVVGWRAAKKRFVKSLANHMSENIPMMVVSRNEERAIEVIGRMKEAGVSASFIPGKGDFSYTILNRQVDNLLRP